ncbi:probable calcium-binding protein CML23 [Exaiptasia diaphana]|uniref:EF-hand domain-containing protein n=1 Tax=Exaiptasia diaphana TaxID=2652724 RepID=A0A913Y925_EXADI|nr:probable calcium-binding protein CML23 [Exaiptasia diaphana]
MGCAPSYPIARVPVLYELPYLYDTSGKRRENIGKLDDTEFKKIQAQYWSKLIEERKKIALNKRKFQEMGEKDFQTLTNEFPRFDMSDILDLRLQFQSFDVNQDGIIDFNELMQVLDDLGDHSDAETRQEYFQQIDVDGSGAIDFEEFLGLIHKLRSEAEDELGQLGNLCKRGTDNIQRVRKLSVAQQMQTGLF